MKGTLAVDGHESVPHKAENTKKGYRQGAKKSDVRRLIVRPQQTPRYHLLKRFIGHHLENGRENQPGKWFEGIFNWFSHKDEGVCRQGTPTSLLSPLTRMSR